MKFFWKGRLLLCGLAGMMCLGPDGDVQAQGAAPATHIWIYASNSMMYGPALSVEGCRMLVRQAARLNSSTGHCYKGAQFLEEIQCQKGHKQGVGPACTYALQPAR